jgi:uncharacterized protein YjbJ (UPF0337 family)
MEKFNDINGDWSETKKKLKQKFIMLTDSDLLIISGQQNEVVDHLQGKLGKTREEIIQLISNL